MTAWTADLKRRIFDLFYKNIFRQDFDAQSKLTENVINMRIDDHLQKKNLHESYNKADTKFQSIESTILKITSDTLTDKDWGKVAMLIIMIYRFCCLRQQWR